MTQPLPDSIGAVIKRYRERELQLSQSDLAWLADVSRGTISNLETARVTPDERTWQRVRTAMAMVPTLPQDPQNVRTRDLTLMPSIAVEGIINAILAIRDEDPDMGQRTAVRWRHLISALNEDGSAQTPEAINDLAWLARDVAIRAAPEKLPDIHQALQKWGWETGTSSASEGGSEPAEDGNLQRLTRVVDQLSFQFRRFNEEVRGFDRLPVRVQDLLNRGLVVDYDIDRHGTTPGVAVVDLVIMEEDEASLVTRRQLIEATRRWSNILMITRYIFENISPEKSPEEIITALQRGLQADKQDPGAKSQR